MEELSLRSVQFRRDVAGKLWLCSNHIFEVGCFVLLRLCTSNLQ